MHQRWWRSPAAMTVGYLLLGLLVVGSIAAFAERNATNGRFLHSIPFRIWIALAAASVAVWLALFGRGLAAIREPGASWSRSRAWWGWNAGAYLGVLVVIVALLSLAQTAPLSVPITHWRALIRLLTVTGVIGAAPWILLVWLAQEQVRGLTGVVEKVPGETSTAEEKKAKAVAVNAAVAELLRTWRVIQSCALALALAITPAILNTGALRLALIDAEVITEDRFPPYAVLAYAVPFAAVVSVAVVPLVVRYRAQAVRLIDRALGEPESGVPSQEWAENRQRLEARLNVDTALLRSPITALSLLTPFATAALTAFVPV